MDRTVTSGAPLEDPGLLSQQVARRIRGDLRDGGLQVGDRLPPERVLTERYGVSRSTLRAALRLLGESGLVGAERSRGWFVSARSSDAGAVVREEGGEEAGRVLGFADHAREQGLAIAARVLEQSVRPASLDEAESLRMAPGRDLFELWRLRFLDGVAIVVEHNRLPLSLCPALADTDFTSASLYATLRAAEPAQVPTSAEYAVEARAATAEERGLLEIDAAVPVLVTSLLASNADGRPVELTRAAYRGDRYRYRASIRGSGAP